MESKECECGLCTTHVLYVPRCSIPCGEHHNQCREWQASHGTAPAGGLCGCDECITEWYSSGEPGCHYPCIDPDHDVCDAWRSRHKTPPSTSTTGSRAAALLRRISDKLEQKAAYYGDSISKSPILVPGMPIETAALVRASDKIARIQHGSGDTTDAWVDLIGYAALVLAMRNAEVD